MPSESRTLVVIVVIMGVLGCGCIAAPLSIAGLVWLKYREVREQVETAAAEQQFIEAQQQARRIPTPDRSAAPRPKPPVIPNPNDLPVTPESPPVEISPPVTPKAPKAPKVRRPPALPDSQPPRGEAGLTDSQKRFTYRSARIHRQIVQQMEKQLDDLRTRGIDTTTLERIIADTRARQEQSLDELCKQRKITRAELDAILTEGDKEGW